MIAVLGQSCRIPARYSRNSLHCYHQCRKQLYTEKASQEYVLRLWTNGMCATDLAKG